MRRCPKCGLTHADAVLTCDCGHELVSNDATLRNRRKHSLKDLGVGVAFVLIGAVILKVLSILEVMVPIPLFVGLGILGVFSVGLVKLTEGAVGLCRRPRETEASTNQASRRTLSSILVVAGVMIVAFAILLDWTEVARGRQTIFSNYFLNVVGLSYDVSHSVALYVNHFTLVGVALWAIAAVLKTK